MHLPRLALAFCLGWAMAACGDDGNSSDGGPVCPVGSDGCACTSAGICDPGLTCLSNICLRPAETDSDSNTGGCAVGSEGCTCTPGGGCDPMLECLSGVCVQPTASTG